MATSLRDRLRLALRAFVLGKGVVDAGDQAWGHDSSTYSPPEYGNYITTSNGVYSCVTLRADLLSSLPLRVSRLRRGERQRVESGPLYELLHKVNPFWTMGRLMKMTEMSLCLWGESFWFLERGPTGKGTPKEIWWGRPDNVDVLPHPTNYIRGYVYRPTNGHPDIYFDPSEVIWLRYPNPLDEYAPLAPLSAGRQAADIASAAMHSNRNLFENGMMAGGFVMPMTGQSLTTEQASDLERKFERRFKGVDKAHRWGVLAKEFQIKGMGVSPKDAEFLGALKWALEDICRVYKIPLDLIGGQRSYENISAAMLAVWTQAIEPEARFIAEELTEQLLPMFGQEADLVEFDLSGVRVLQEAEGERWTRAKEQIQIGALTVNQWRRSHNEEPVAWGDAWWASAALVPVTSADALPIATPDAAPVLPRSTAATQTRAQQRDVAYGSPEHERLWRAFARRTQRQEQKLGKAVADLLKRQQASVIGRLTGRSARSAEEVANQPFSLEEWIKKFRSELRPLLKEIVLEAAEEAWDGLNIGGAFDVTNPEVAKFIEQRAQRFAQLVNETTYAQLQTSLAVGTDAGESIALLTERVNSVMEGRIRSSAETIARTEVIGASNGGALRSYQASGVVEKKAWLAALDDRTRETHKEAHGQTVGLDEDFKVGGAVGPAPGQMGKADEDVNCRCAIRPVLGD